MIAYEVKITGVPGDYLMKDAPKESGEWILEREVIDL